MESAKKKGSRRRALSPLIQQSSEVQPDHFEGAKESVVIHRLSTTQETRIYSENRPIDEDLRRKTAEVRELTEKLEKSEEKVRNLTEKLGISEVAQHDEELKNSAMRRAVRDLEEQVFTREKELTEARDLLRISRLEISSQKTDFDSKMMTLESKRSKAVAQIEVAKEESKIQLQKINELTAELDRVRKQLAEKDELIKLSTHTLETQARKSLEAHREDQNTQKVLSEFRQISARLDCMTPQRKVDEKKWKEHEEYLQMSAKVIGETMEDLRAKNARLEKELAEKTEVAMSLKEKLEEVKVAMQKMMGDNEQSSKYLHEENLKIVQITREKADIRCDLLKARRELAEFDKKRLELEKLRDEALEDVQRIQKEKKTVEKELETLKTLASERDEQIEELKTKIADFEMLKRENEMMKSELKRTNDKFNESIKYLAIADQQAAHFKAAKEQTEGSRRRAVEQCNEMVVKIRNLEERLQNQRKIEQEVETLRAENERQTSKIAFMKEEIEETHLDYRQEIAKLGAELRHEADQEQLRLQMSQKDTQLRSSAKTIEELRADNAKLQKILDEMRVKQDGVLEENVRLRKGMADALAKIEEYKRQWESAQEVAERLEREAGEKEKRVTELEEELQEKTQQISESEQVISYLHSQINTKQNKQPKLGRRSTLLSTVSEMDTSVYQREAEEVAKLEEERQLLMRDLAQKRRQLADQKSISTANTTTVISETTVTQTHSQSATELAHPKATMRHDIPHKWKEFRHLGVFSIKCSLCFEGIPTLHKAKKCAHCDIHVHATCACRVNNTCGMPVQVATYYRDNVATNNSSVSEGRMNGWMRVYRDDEPGSTWIASWAMMDLTRISFYTNDGADLEKPFFSIDLNKEQWVLRSRQEMPVECDDSMRASNVLMIKMPRRNVYILAPSQPAALRWAQCLQTAQRKRMMLNSKPASMAEYSCMLVLDSPNNLRIFKAHTIEDWILFATATGLFYTSISQPRNPIRIAGMSSVTALEAMAEINCVAMVVNSNSQLALVPMDSLSLAMQSTQPSIRPEVLPEFRHVSAIKYHQQNGQRYLVIADETHVHIRKYNATKDVFSHFVNLQKISVMEPVTFIQSAPSGILFASEAFYYIPLDTSPIGASVTARALLPPKQCDFPISALIISRTEILLAFQNYGIFVDFSGRPTRKNTIEWEKMPLEFTYTAPFLYIVHDDSIEILEVLTDSEDNVAVEREVFECANAHIIGRQYEGVIISVASEQSTEVHRFTASQKRVPNAKRRGASPINSLKRSKH